MVYQKPFPLLPFVDFLIATLFTSYFDLTFGLFAS